MPCYAIHEFSFPLPIRSFFVVAAAFVAFDFANFRVKCNAIHICMCVCLCVVAWNIHYFKLFTDTSTHKSLIQLHTHSCATMILINISRFYGCSLFGESAFCFFLSNSVIFLSSCCFGLPSVSRYSFFSSFAMATFELNNDSFFSLCLLSLAHCTKTFDLFIDNEWIAHSLFVFHFRKHSAIIQMEYAFNLKPGNRRHTLRVLSCHLGMICVFLSAFYISLFLVFFASLWQWINLESVWY